MTWSKYKQKKSNAQPCGNARILMSFIGAYCDR